MEKSEFEIMEKDLYLDHIHLTVTLKVEQELETLVGDW